jgi:hypothetical protein
MEMSKLVQDKKTQQKGQYRTAGEEMTDDSKKEEKEQQDMWRMREPAQYTRRRDQLRI